MVTVTTDNSGRSILRIADSQDNSVWDVSVSSSDIPKNFSIDNGGSLRVEVIDDVINKAPQSNHALFLPVNLVAIVQRDGDTRYTYVNKFESRQTDPIQFSGSFTIIKQGTDTDVAYDINNLYLRVEFVTSNQDQTASSDSIDLSGSSNIGSDGRKINADHSENADQVIQA